MSEDLFPEIRDLGILNAMNRYVVKEFLRTSKVSVVRLYDSSKKLERGTEEVLKLSIRIEESKFISGPSDIYGFTIRNHAVTGLSAAWK